MIKTILKSAEKRNKKQNLNNQLWKLKGMEPEKVCKKKALFSEN